MGGVTSRYFLIWSYNSLVIVPVKGVAGFGIAVGHCQVHLKKYFVAGKSGNFTENLNIL